MKKRRSARLLKHETKDTSQEAMLVEIKSRVDEKELEMLKEFDLHMKFGPFIGINRSSRWARAERLDLNPPIEVKEILKKSSPEYEKDIWYETLK